MLTFKHSGNVGDALASLPTVKALLAKHGEPVGTFYLQTDIPAKYPAWIKHPCGTVRMTQHYASMLVPLLNKQPYLHAKLYRGEEITYDLDLFRTCGLNLSAGDLSRYYRAVFPVCPPTWEPWLSVTPNTTYKDCVIVNRTSRYHNQWLSYSFLTFRNVCFMGTKDEYVAWRKEFLLQVPYVPSTDFLTAAQAIAGCKLFIGNQSSCFQIAEGLKVPRILEVCPTVPNVAPCGPNGYEAHFQDHFEQLVKELR